MRGECLAECVVYQATVTTQNTKKSYIGSTEGKFKTRYNNHTHSFRNTNKRNATCLSTFVHSSREQNGAEPKIEWEALHKCHPYGCGTRKCDLCLTEKLHILKGKNLINKRTELLAKCRHSTKFKLISA